MRKRKKSKRQRYKQIAVLTFSMGILILLYPFAATRINSVRQTQAVDGYISQVKTLTEEEKQRLWEEAENYNKKIKNNGVVMTEPFDAEEERLTMEEYMHCLNTEENGMMSYLDIPSIKVHLPVYHTTSSEVLAKAVGHLRGTSLPVGGEDTHCVLSAHTGVAGNRLFTDLTEVKVGETFSITTFDKTLAYRVYQIETVLPENIESLMIQEGKDLCTLVTCTPYGINTHRLLVHGIRIEKSNAAKRKPDMTDKRTILFWCVLSGISLAIILATAGSLK